MVLLGLAFPYKIVLFNLPTLSIYLALMKPLIFLGNLKSLTLLILHKKKKSEDSIQISIFSFYTQLLKLNKGLIQHVWNTGNKSWDSSSTFLFNQFSQRQSALSTLPLSLLNLNPNSLCQCCVSVSVTRITLAFALENRLLTGFIFWLSHAATDKLRLCEHWQL